MNILRAAEDDLDSLIRLHMLCFPAYLNTNLGKNYLKAMFRWFIQYRPGLVLLAKDESGICGYILGAPSGYNSRLTKSLLLYALIGTCAHPHIFLKKKFWWATWLKLRSLFLKKNTGENHTFFSVTGICVLPGKKNQSIATRLMDAYSRKILSDGYTELRAFSYNDNLEGQSFFTASGWNVYQSSSRGKIFFKRLG